METVFLPFSRNTLDHELRTPLTGIINLLNFLLDDKEPLTLTEQKTYLEDTKCCVNRLRHFIEKISSSAQAVQMDSSTDENSEDITKQYCAKTPRILLVEDDQIIQHTHKKWIMKCGYEVEIAVNGQEAIEMAARGYDIILMDIGLPKLNGLDATKEIRKQEGVQKHTPIIGVTGYGSEKETECLAAGMDAVLLKPATYEDLQLTIQKFL
jgi:CheY-like chemotaxis protein